jgi:hypothetical protein
MKRQSFNNGWIFYNKGSNIRRTIDLPHDAIIEDRRDPAGLGGVYVYE